MDESWRVGRKKNFLSALLLVRYVQGRDQDEEESQIKINEPKITLHRVSVRTAC